jgi:DNA helicase-2/ATP-dependent DNA helicase PcrA
MASRSSWYGGCGGGKTRVVTYRVARLLETGVSRTTSSYSLSQTRRPGRCSTGRTLIKIDTRYIWGGTFHHISNMILRQNSKQVGQGHFTILDNEDADLIKVVMRDAKIDRKEGDSRRTSSKRCSVTPLIRWNLSKKA